MPSYSPIAQPVIVSWQRIALEEFSLGSIDCSPLAGFCLESASGDFLSHLGKVSYLPNELSILNVLLLI